MTPAEKMAARLNGTTTVNSYPPSLPESVPEDHTSPEARIRSKQARHALEQEQKRLAAGKTERKAEVVATSAAEKPPEPKPEAPVATAPSEPPRDDRNRDHRNRR